MGTLLVEKYGITREFVEIVLEKEFGCRPSIDTVKILGDTVIGYMSAIVRVTLVWPNEDKQLPRSVIAKIPSPELAAEAWKACGHQDEEESQEDPIHELMHNTEVASYTLFRDFPPENVRIPLLYGYKEWETGNPVLIMEDVQGGTVDLIDGFNEEQLYAIVDQLVALHKWSHKHDHAWRSRFDILKEGEAQLIGFARSLVPMADHLAKQYPEISKTIDILKKNLLHDERWFVRYVNECCQDPNAVFAHGDLWAPQILWQGNQVMGIVDWALCRAGTMTEDLLRAITTCSPLHYRRNISCPLLQYYAKKMELPFHVVQEDFNKTLLFTCAMTTFAVGMWVNSSVLRRGLEDDEKRINEMLHRLQSLVEDTADIHDWTI